MTDSPQFEVRKGRYPFHLDWKKTNQKVQGKNKSKVTLQHNQVIL